VNVAVENELSPRKGVYAGWVQLPEGEIRRSVINIGTNPTFEDADAVSLEAHILDFSGDLYGERIGVFFTQRLRDERRFPSADDLVAAIQEDIQDARALLKTPAVSIPGDGMTRGGPRG